MSKLVPLWFTILMPAVSIVGFLGNLFIIIRFILRPKMLKSNINMMVFSLALFDVGYLVVNNVQFWPNIISDSSAWIYPIFVCPIYHLFYKLSLSGQILMHISITIERFFIIMLPKLATKYCTTRNVLLAIATVWLLATASGIPSYLASEVVITKTKQPLCFYDPENSFHETYSTVLLYLDFVVPIVFSIVLYIPMFCKLAKKTKREHCSRNERNERKSALRMMICCIVSFTVCYLPTFLAATSIIDGKDFNWISAWLLIVSCAINPCSVLFFRWRHFWHTEKEESDINIAQRCCQSMVNTMSPIRAFKFDYRRDTYKQTGLHSSTNIAGSFVNLHIDAEEMVFFVRNCNLAQHCWTEVVYLDELLDAYVGNSNNTTKAELEDDIDRIPNSRYSKLSARCALTVVYGSDLRNTKKMVLVTGSERNAQAWCNALRECSEVARQRMKAEQLYSWRRHLATVFCKYTTLAVPFKTFLKDLLPFVNPKQRERLCQRFLRGKHNWQLTNLLSDKEEQIALYAMIIGRENDPEFLQFLRSDISPSRQLPIDMDYMNHPLSHYYINSSHNSYLKDRQVLTSACISIYRHILRAGCRCIELDCWDGNNGEPVITHGYAFVSNVLFKDVLQAIKEEAFTTSTFPLILSLDNNCSPVQQTKMAEYLEQILGPMLLKSPLKDYPLTPGWPLPSPIDLRCKILIKNKKLDSPTSPQTHISARLSALVNYTRATSNFPGFMQCAEANMSSTLFSFSESTAGDLIRTDAPDFIKHNERQLSRIYPDGYRVDSSNYDPMPFWTAGCQLVALNLQTPGLPTQMNSAFFERNGRTGYVLKPESMRIRDFAFDPSDVNIQPNVLERSISFSITILEGHLWGSLCSDDSHLLIKLKTHGISADQRAAKFEVDFSGLNVSFGRDVELRLENMILPSLAMVHISVSKEVNNKFIGEALLNVAELRTGLKLIPLNDKYGSAMGAAMMLVDIKVEPYMAATTHMLHRIQPAISEIDNEHKSVERTEPGIIKAVTCIHSEDNTMFLV